MDAAESLALAGALVVALAGVATALPRAMRAGLSVQAAGLALLGIAGAVAVGRGGGESVFVAGIDPTLGLDPLSGFFVALLAVVAVPTLLFARDSLGGDPGARVVGALLAPFTLSLAGVLVARDAISFLAFWEVMTLVPAAAILVVRRDAGARAAVQVYVAITHLGGAGVWLALLALAAPAAASHALIAVAALVGFGAKAGLVPLHTWLPRAHPVAPVPFSALMSGLMVAVALYGLIRVQFEWLGSPPQWLGYALLAVGLVSALGGVLWALVQQGLKRLLAFSTIENVGLAAVLLGVSILATDPGRARLAFAAALFQIAAHAVIKVLLFLGAGAIERATGTLDLDNLGGLLRRLPWTGAAFGIGCAALAGLPTLTSFVSEWLTLQSLAGLAVDGPLGPGLAGAVGLAAIAATAALALLCFAKVAGLVLLGPARSDRAADSPVGMRAALVALAGVGVAVGVMPGPLLGVLGELAPDPGPVTLAPPGTGGLPATALAVVLIVVTVLLVRARGGRRAAPAPTWTCGQPVTRSLSWTSAAFTKPLRLGFDALLRPGRELEVERAGGLVQRIRYSRVIHSPSQRLLYGPVIRAALGGAGVARRLQTGNVRTYAAYLLALVFALLALVRTGALG